jgi:GNAT superfamily N-acetyltransferase
MPAVHARRGDIPSWLEIVREVEPLFGPMPDFQATLERNIDRGSAICVRDDDGRVLGGALLGGAAPDRWIRWLAVRADARGRGVGAGLIDEALRRFAPPCTVSLDTFGEDNEAGLPARRLYLRYGFEPREMLPNGPEGGTRQLFVLARP